MLELSLWELNHSRDMIVIEEYMTRTKENSGEAYDPPLLIRHRVQMRK